MFATLIWALEPAASAAEEAGRWTGVAVIVVGMILGIIKTIRVMMRPTTNKLCLVALLLVLVAWLGSAPLSWLVEMPSPTARIVTTLVFFLMLLLCGVAVFVAIIGLSMFDRTRHQQGRAQAIWAICLGCFFGVMGLAGFVRGLSGGMSSPSGIARRANDPPLPPRTSSLELIRFGRGLG